MSRSKQQNELTSRELLSQVLPQNLQLLKDFCSYLKSTQKSEGTIRGYRNDIEICLCWNLQYNGNKLFTKIKKRDVVALQNWLVNENGNSPARVRRIKAALSSFSNYISSVLDDEYEDFIPVIRKIESPALNPVYDKTVLTPDEVQRILETLVEQKRYQIACAFALAIACGARKSELVRFNVDFFKEENIIYGSLWKTPPIKTKGRSGGKYISKYVLVSVFRPYLDIWMQERERAGITNEELFVTKAKGETEWSPATDTTMNSWAAIITKILGKSFYWHSARHYWTSYLLRAGIPDDAVTVLSGWESVDMVATYDDRDKDEVFSKYFKDGRIVVPQKREFYGL